MYTRDGRSTKKKRRDDDVDIMNNVMNVTNISNKLFVDKVTRKVAKVNYEFSYWIIPEAKKNLDLTREKV